MWFLSYATGRLESGDDAWEVHMRALYDSFMSRGPMLAEDIGWPVQIPRLMIESDL